MTIIDVSKYQGYVDWALVKRAGIQAGYAKATGEETAGPVPFRDARFLGNWRMMAAAGFTRGAYHFMDGGKGSATGLEEAAFFLKTVDDAGGFKPGDLRPALDVEWPPKSGALFQIEQLGEAVEYLRRELGKYPVLYTGRWYWYQITDAADFEELEPCPLWIASYTKRLPDPPQPWSKISLHQYTDKGAVNGIAGNVDMNNLLVPLSELTL